MFKHLLIYLTHPHVDSWTFKPRHHEKIMKSFPEMQVTVAYGSKEFRDALSEADAVIVWFFKKEWLKEASHLKWIFTPAAGRDWVDVEANETVSVSFGGFHGSLIAESVIGAMFYFCKAFGASKRFQNKKKWARIKLSAKIQSLEDSHVAILGFGRIGQEIGRKLKPLGCRITGIKRVPVGIPEYFTDWDRVVLKEEMDDVIKEVDHIIMVMPGGQETDRVFTSRHFGLLPRNCFLYNVGRGNVYRESDLVDTLTAGNISGAYLDVFEQEPLPENSKLWDFENVLIQPHLSAASPHYLDRFVEEWVDKVKCL